jgi:myo-inositol-1(or 4)-monophosphatase
VRVPLRIEALTGVADAAAALAREGAAAPLGVLRKADGSPVTAVDSAVNAYLRRELGELLPGSGWLSEETSDDRVRLDRDLVWIVDPIDGTKQLVSGIPEVAISIGLVLSGRVIAASVVNPMTGESGTWVEGAAPVFVGLNPAPIPSSLDETVAIVSRSETEEGGLDGLDGLVGAMRPVGSVAYKLLRVAAGADALTFSLRPKSEWDVCGGVGLVKAAGRVYLRLDGGPLRFNQADTRIPSGAVAGPASLAKALRKRLSARRPKY